MKKIVSFVSLALAAAGAVAGCSVDASGGPDQEAIATGEAAACSNLDGTNAMMASLATAIATEIHRMEITTDFEIYRGTYNQEMLRITYNTRNTICTAANNNCRNVDALLAFQDPRNDQVMVFKDGTRLNSWTFASRLVAGWRAQKNCLDRARNGDPNACTAEYHYMEKTSSNPTLCGGVDYGLRMVQFKVSKANSAGQKLSPETPLYNPDVLQRKFLWTDPDQTLPANGNPYLQFKLINDKVGCEMDPGDGTSEEPPPPAACGTTALKYYPAPNPDITGTCCTVNGSNNTVYRKYNLPSMPYVWTGYYRCQ